MKNLNDFLKDLDKNADLKQKFENTSDLKEICNLAKRYGYEFSENELTEFYLESVSGGSLVDTSDQSGSITLRTEGDGNTQMNFGSVTISKGNSYEGNVDPMEVLKLLFGN